MVYAFTEGEKKQIESCGMMVVEFKRNLRMIESMSKAVYRAWDRLIELAKTVGKVLYEVCKKFNEAIDDIRLAFEEIRDSYDYSTSRRYTLGENNGRYYYHIESESFTNFPLTTMSGWSTKGLCTHFQYNNPYSFEGDAAVCLNQNGTNKVRIGFADNINDVEYVKSYVLEQKNTGNPVRLYFVLESPIETDLPAEEIAAYKALYTYTPNTSVGNDAGAWMKVGYKANT